MGLKPLKDSEINRLLLQDFTKRYEHRELEEKTKRINNNKYFNKMLLVLLY